MKGNGFGCLQTQEPPRLESTGNYYARVSVHSASSFTSSWTERVNIKNRAPPNLLETPDVYGEGFGVKQDKA